MPLIFKNCVTAEMKILCEHNAFQHIDDCIEGRCKFDKNDCDSYYQVEDFLQFCVQIILHDKIYLVGTVPKDVLHKSEELRIKLENNGIQDVFTIISFGGNNTDNIDQETKKLMKVAVPNTLANFDKALSFSLEYKEKPTDYMYHLFSPLSDKARMQIEECTDAVNQGNQRFFSGYHRHANICTDCGITEVLCDEKVIKKLFTFDRTIKWNVSMMIALMAYIRVVINSTYAQQKGYVYVPSVSRARKLYDLDSSYKQPYVGEIYNKFEVLFVESADPLSKKVHTPKAGFSTIKNIIVPSLTRYLVGTASGNVSGILKETVNMRSHFTRVRDYLQEGNEKDIAARVSRRLSDIETMFDSQITQTDGKQASLSVWKLNIGKYWERTANKKAPEDARVSAFTGKTWDISVGKTNKAGSSPEDNLIADCTKNSPK